MMRTKRARTLVAGLLSFVAAVFLFFAAAAIAARPLRGTIDRSFGHNGRFFSELGDTSASSQFTSIVRQPDGKLVLTATVQAAYGRSSVMVQRREPTGDLDPSFGNGGAVFVRKASSGSGLAIQADGRILFGIQEREGCNPTSTVRSLRPNGTTDPSFGSGGVSATVPFSVNRIAVDAEDRILVAGAAFYACGKGPPPPAALMIARLRADGTLDPSFGANGVAYGEREIGTFATGLAVREDGTILLAGIGSLSLLHLSADGTLDPSFGNAAKPVGYPKALLALPGGEAVLASSNSRTNVRGSCCWEHGDFVLSRYKPDGSLNTNFGSDGRVTIDVGDFDEASALALSPDGSIVLAGGVADTEDCAAGDCAFTPILARFTPGGALDPSFGQGGRTPVEFPGRPPGYGYIPWIAALAIAPSGQILAAGGAGRRSDAFVVAREPSGQPDPGFGDAGSINEIRKLPSWTEPLGLAIEPSGEILVSASSNTDAHMGRGVLLGLKSNGRPDPETGSGAGFIPTETSGPVGADKRNRVYQVEGSFVARFDNRGQRDRLYGSDGAARLPDHFVVGSFLVRHDGRVLVVGHIANHHAFAAFQLTPHGFPDQSFGQGGLATAGFRQEEARAQSVSIDPLGRILLVGKVGRAGAAARLLADGNLDPRFARHGRLVDLPTRGADVTDVSLQADGKILVAASPEDATKPHLTSLMRFGHNGARDRSFGHDGVLRIGGRAQLLSVFAGGRQIILITKRGFSGDGYGVVLHAYRANGGVDHRFGRHGVLTTPTTSGGRTFRPIIAARQPNGRIVVAGTARKVSQPGAAVELLRFR